MFKKKCGYSKFKYITEKKNTYIIWSNAEFELKLPTLAVIISEDEGAASIWSLSGTPDILSSIDPLR